MDRLGHGSSEVVDTLKCLPDSESMNTYLASTKYERITSKLYEELYKEVMKLSSIASIQVAPTTDEKNDLDYRKYSSKVDIWKDLYLELQVKYSNKDNERESDREAKDSSNGKRHREVDVEGKSEVKRRMTDKSGDTRNSTPSSNVSCKNLLIPEDFVKVPPPPIVAMHKH